MSELFISAQQVKDFAAACAEQIIREIKETQTLKEEQTDDESKGNKEND